MWRRLELYDYACCNAVQHIQFHNMYRKVKNRIVQCFKKKLGLKYNHVEYKKGVTELCTYISPQWVLLSNRNGPKIVMRQGLSTRQYFHKSLGKCISHYNNKNTMRIRDSLKNQNYLC